MKKKFEQISIGMCRKSVKWISLMAAMVILFSTLPMHARAASKQYSPAKAVAKAESLSNSKSGSCDGFVKKCLSAGGISVPVGGAGSVVSWLEKNNYGTVSKVNINKLKSGDLILVSCDKCTKNGSYWGLHIILCSSVSSSNIKYYARNNYKNNATLNKTTLGKYHEYWDKCNNGHGNSNFSTLMFNFNTVDSSGTKVIATPKAQSSKITIANAMLPNTSYVLGSANFVPGGIISSEKPLTLVLAEICNLESGQVIEFVSGAVGNTYDLANAYPRINLHTIPAGSYQYSVIAVDTNGYQEQVLSRQFSITPQPNADDHIIEPNDEKEIQSAEYDDIFLDGLDTDVYDGGSDFNDTYGEDDGDGSIIWDAAPTPAPAPAPAPEPAPAPPAPAPAEAPSRITIKEYTAPTGSQSYGYLGFYLRGYLQSTYKMANVTVAIYDTNGKVVQSKTVNPNATSYDMGNATINNVILFRNLKKGSYVYRVIATDLKGVTIKLVESKFTKTN